MIGSGLHDIAREAGLPASAVQFLETEFKDLVATLDVMKPDRVSRDRLIRFFQLAHQYRIVEKKSDGEARRLILLAFRPDASSMPRVLAVTSGKGGVGKSTVAVNLAAACAALGGKPLLLDADLGLANVHIIAGIKPKKTLIDVLFGGARLEDVIEEGPGGVKLICGGSGESSLANLPPEWTYMLDVRRMDSISSYSPVILDTGAGISKLVVHFLGMADDILVVATPNLSSMLDAYGVLKIVHQGKLSGRVHMLMNQVSGEAEARTIYERIAECSQRFLQVRPAYLGYIEASPEVERSHRERRPLVLSQPGTTNALRFEELAGKFIRVAERSDEKPAMVGAHSEMEQAGGIVNESAV